ncbi:hypothetical protein FRC96_12465 [Lujinxingia vulgaris]|uniref:Alpha/beta hydrolase n=1 Tax=Lujinxingia vulgaris TaxID=2600176 RepID=A0A5C6X807_9DELT|nr:hypothetical protein [Lujinxingia vulgaris]TXD34867.1 hypothetical protein FRC96_12465 [Lujinxingia vulgaris]
MAPLYIAYVGAGDGLAAEARAAQESARRLEVPLTVNYLEGDHFNTLAPAVELFLEEIQALD